MVALETTDIPTFIGAGAICLGGSAAVIAAALLALKSARLYEGTRDRNSHPDSGKTTPPGSPRQPQGRVRKPL